MFMFMVFNTTFNNISVISWRSFLLVGEPGKPPTHGKLLSDYVVSSTPGPFGVDVKLIYSISDIFGNPPRYRHFGMDISCLFL